MIVDSYYHDAICQPNKNPKELAEAAVVSPNEKETISAGGDKVVVAADVGQMVKMRDSPADLPVSKKQSEEDAVSEALEEGDALNGPADYFHHGSALQLPPQQPRDRSNESQSAMSLLTSSEQEKNETATASATISTVSSTSDSAITSGSNTSNNFNNVNSSPSPPVATSTLAHQLNDRNHMSSGLGGASVLGKGNMGQGNDHHHYQYNAQQDEYRHPLEPLRRHQGSIGIETGFNGARHHQRHPSSRQQPPYFPVTPAKTHGGCGNNKMEMCVSSPIAYDEQNNIIVPPRAITSSSPNGSTSSSPANSIMTAAQHRNVSIETSGGKKHSMPAMMIPQSHHETMQNTSYRMNGEVDDRCRSRNGSSSGGSGSYDDHFPATVPQDMSPGGYSMSNKSFCSTAEGDSPPSPSRFHKNGGGGRGANNNHPGQFQWMKHSAYGTVSFKHNYFKQLLHI